MSTSVKPSAYLPTLELARAAKLPLHDAQPQEQLRLAALLVDAQIVRRDCWSEIDAVREEDFERLSNNTLPADANPGAVYHVIGRVIEQTPHWVRCRVDHYFDKVVELKETWVPSPLHTSPMRHFEAALESMIMNAAAPEELRCTDLTPKAVGGAYRSAQTTRQPDFHGYDFGDALAAAEKSVNSLLVRGTVVSSDIRAWAWPFLWLRYPHDADCILFFDPSCRLHLYTGE